ncbi:MAG: filamentous hemagglutinin N-terminal domain-containing protein [Symploca sp. SIO2E9]|nr:filamentous hemagglutinin N-terminal domain-containing protein [Symploca sp. SIO2E9]
MLLTLKIKNYLTIAGTIPLIVWLAYTSLANRVLAQITPDNTLGNESSVVTPNVDVKGALADLIEGGAIRDINLFHSFLEFNVSDGGRVYFANPVGIENILSRVTGGNPSDIFGTLGVLGEANLFLINPNGIFFGPNASLDVEASFVGTTANAVGFSDQGSFSATNPEAPPLLRVHPDAFFFNILAAQRQNAIESRANLALPVGESLLLLGGNVAPNAEATGGILFDGDTIVSALGGRVELAGVGEVGKVGLAHENGSLRLIFPENLERTDISVVDTFIGVQGSGGGDIGIYAKNLALSDSSIVAGINFDSGSEGTQAGDILIDATGEVTIADGSIVNFVLTGAKGKGGNVEINTSSLSLTDGARIIASTFGEGDGGSILIRATETVSVDGEDAGGSPSGIFTDVGSEAQGNGGDVKIETGSLFLTNGAQIGANLRGEGNSGSVLINARETVFLDRDSLISSILRPGAQGNGGNVEIDTSSLSLNNGADIFANIFLAQGDAGSVLISATDTVSVDKESFIISIVFLGSQGNAGNIEIETGSLRISNGGQISSTILSSQGDAGSVLIRATDTVSIEGEDADGTGSGITSLVDSGSQGNAGNVDIKTASLLVSNGAQINVTTSGEGNAGSILIRATDTVSVDNSSVNSQVNSEAKGNGGSVEIETSSLLVSNDGLIDTSTLGEGDAGSILIHATDKVSVDDGDIGSSVIGGQGNSGNIEIETGSLLMTNRAVVDTTTFGEGNAGSVLIRATDKVSVDESFVSSSVSPEAKGNAGSVAIETDHLSLSNGTLVVVSTLGEGDAGLVLIRATDTISVDDSSVTSVVGPEAKGNAGSIEIEADFLLLTNVAIISAGTSGEGNAGSVLIRDTDSVSVDNSFVNSLVNSEAKGNAGDVEIDTGSLHLTNGAQISSGTSGEGNAGSVLISATETISLDEETVIGSSVESGAKGDGGSVEIDTGSLYLTNGAFINVGTFGTGDAGDIILTVEENLNAEDSGISTIAASNTGDAGDIILTVEENLTAENSFISAESILSAGGAIEIKAGEILLFGDSDIRTNVLVGTEGGGNITLTADSIIAFDDSDILAFARDGAGGDIIFNTPAFFGENYRPAPRGTNPETLDDNNRVDINASGGIDGVIILPDVSFIQNSLNDLPEALVNPDILIAGSCIIPTNEPQGSLYITGAGGLPTRPGDISVAPFPTGIVKPIGNSGDSPNSVSRTNRRWQKGDPIVEPTGVYQLPDGRLVMGRECSRK